MNGTELRSFSHFQILRNITYPDLSRNLESWLKVSQDNQVRMQTLNGTDIRSFSHFQILTWIVYSDLSRNIGNWLILNFVFIHCKTLKISQNDQIQIINKCFLDDGTELQSFSDFQILTWIAYLVNLENWLILKFLFFTVKLWKSVKKIKFECKHDLQLFSWWMEQNYKVLVVFKFWHGLPTLGEILKID